MKHSILIEKAPPPIMYTYTGLKIDLLNPSQKCIHISDIAHALAMQCRFGGRTSQFYSVAEHSVRVSHVVPPEDALWALLHDAAEAYLVDIPRPIKYLPEMEGYFILEDRFMKAIIEKFGLQEEPPKSVQIADNVLLITEKRDLIGSNESWRDSFPELEPLDETIVPWGWRKAKREFLKRFGELTKLRLNKG